MRDITIFRHQDWTARWVVWKDASKPTKEELTPEWAVYLTYSIMPNEFCEYVQHETQEKVNKLLNDFIWK